MVVPPIEGGLCIKWPVGTMMTILASPGEWFWFDLILYIPSTIFHAVIKGWVFLGGTSTKLGLMCLAQGHNAVTSVRLKQAAPRSRVKHSTTEPLRSLPGVWAIRFRAIEVLLYFFLLSWFILANSADPDEMQQFVAFHLGLHCLQKYPFTGFHSTKG